LKEAKEVIEYLLREIVDFPDKLNLSEVEDEKITVLEIRVDPSDMGKVIGKQGRVIKAIRTIVKAATIKDKKRTVIEIID
jgi:uncharacterized protein